MPQTLVFLHQKVRPKHPFLGRRIYPLDVRLLNRLLVPVDGSTYAKRALEFAIGLAKICGSTITIMYVVPRRVYVAAQEAGFIPVPALIHDLEELGKEVLEEAEDMVQTAGVKSVEKVLIHGIPAEEILKTSDVGKYDMIVIGSRGRTAAKAFILGSVSHKVSHHAKCPVLIVK